MEFHSLCSLSQEILVSIGLDDFFANWCVNKMLVLKESINEDDEDDEVSIYPTSSPRGQTRFLKKWVLEEEPFCILHLERASKCWRNAKAVKIYMLCVMPTTTIQ